MNRLLHDLVSQQIDGTPQATAIWSGAAEERYESVEARSNQLARLLRIHGCQRGDRVGVLAPPAAVGIVAMLAVLKADGIYVPLDPSTALPRLAEILRTCRPTCLLTTGSAATLAGRLAASAALAGTVRFGALETSEINTQGFVSDFSLADAARESTLRPASRNRAASPAYLLFPPAPAAPGVIATHEAAVRFLAWAVDQFSVRVGDRHPLFSSPAEHWSIYQALGTLAGGATLVVAPGSLAKASHMSAFIRRARLTQLCCSSTLLEEFVAADVVGPGDFPTLRHMLWWGPTLGARALRYLRTRLGHVQFTAFLGPLEATMASAYYTVRGTPARGGNDALIGRACPGYEMLLVDDDVRPLAVGERGEVSVRGVGLSPGYWSGSAEESSGPQSQGRALTSGKRLLRTGAVGLRTPDGRICLIDSAGEPDSHA